MFHIIWAILFIIKLYKSVANAPECIYMVFNFLFRFITVKTYVALTLKVHSATRPLPRERGVVVEKLHGGPRSRPCTKVLDVKSKIKV